MSLPLPRFDHLVINARGRLDEAEACYRGLGFALTPRGYHTLGSINHCAVFASDYLELIGLGPRASGSRAELMNFPEGLNGLVFATSDAAALYETLRAAGAPVEPPADFSRPVSLPKSTREARFRVVRIKAEAAPYGRVYFCQHFTPKLVWRDEWRTHPNGASAIARAVILAADPDQTATLYRQLFGAQALTHIADGWSLAAGDARLDIVSQAWDTQAEGKDRLLGLSLRTNGPARIVPASEGFGAIVEFVA